MKRDDVHCQTGINEQEKETPEEENVICNSAGNGGLGSNRGLNLAV